MKPKYSFQVNFGYPIVVFDTETGGLNSDDYIEFSKDPDIKLEKGDQISGIFMKPAAPILEIGAVKLDPISLEETDVFHALLGPEEGQTVDDLFSICDDQALAVNGLGERKKEFETALPGSVILESFIKWATKETKWFQPAGQNVRYDMDMVNSSCVRYGIDYTIRNSPLELLCYSKLYFSLPDTPIVANYKLTTVSEALGLSTEGAHEALADVRMTSECMRIMFERFGGEK
jgi:DNA polymerase III epsilon subunit-like protein